MKLKAVLVTGTPSTGKTTVSKALAEEMSCKYIDVKEIIKEQGLNEGYDDKRKCDIVDENKLRKILDNMIENTKGCLVIDSHMSHFSTNKNTVCIVTRCGIAELEKRMKERDYDEDKIEDNKECEIMEVCENEAFELGHELIIVDTTNSFDMKKIKEEIKNKIK